MHTLRQRQSGFTLIELSIAVLIGLFLIGGLLTMLQSNRRAFNNQSQLSLLQDNERLAMTMITDVVQQAGYFPNPVSYTSTGLLTADAPLIAGQSVYAVANGTPAYGDVLTIRYASASPDGVLNCNGTTNSSATPALYKNAFSVGPATSVPANWPFSLASTNSLYCSLNNATPVELVTGVQSLTVWYGVKRGTYTNNSFDTYVTSAAAMTASDWANLICIRVTLTFQNPLYVAGQSSSAVLPNLTFTRVIGIMNQSGIKL